MQLLKRMGEIYINWRGKKSAPEYMDKKEATV